MTLLGATDLLWLMGEPMRAEYKQARAWINDVITFDRDFQADTFTLSMTFLGSLLALYDLTGDGMFLKKALDLADRCEVYTHACSCLRVV
jgi:mannosyl-oligosaccharide alpha-1,2-mannosidase